MNSQITAHDVFQYHAGLLDLDRRKAVEEAYDTDPQVRDWFDELASTELVPDQAVRATTDLDDPGYARIAAIAYEVVSREEIMSWLDDPIMAPQPPFKMELNRPIEVGDAMACRQAVPKGLGGHPATTTDYSPVEFPYIRANFETESLRVCQRRNDSADGRVDIVVVGLRGAESPVSYRTKGWQLKGSTKCWYADFPLRGVLPDGWKHFSELLFFVLPADDNEPTANKGEQQR